MRLTAEEKEICKSYSARDKDGFVHCHDCPLAIDKKSALCKRTITKQEWDARNTRQKVRIRNEQE